MRLADFGASSLDFELLYWTDRSHAFEDIKSDLRYKIEAEFRRKNIRIPFPQQDIHIRSDLRDRINQTLAQAEANFDNVQLNQATGEYGTQTTRQTLVNSLLVLT